MRLKNLTFVVCTPKLCVWRATKFLPKKYTMKIMNYCLFFAYLSICWCCELAAQTTNVSMVDQVSITEMTELGKTGYKMTIPAANASLVNTEWKRWLKNCKGKTRLGKEGYFTDNAVMPALSGKPIDIYSEVDKYANGSIVKVFFDLGDNYLNAATQPLLDKVAQQMLTDFGKTQSLKALQAMLLVEERKMLQLSNDRKKLHDNEKNINQQIAAAREVVTRTELLLRENNQQQEKKDAETVQQISKVEQIKKSIAVMSAPK